MIDLSILMPEFAERLKEFVLEAQYKGLDVDVQSAYRSLEEQNLLYALGRTAKNSDGYQPVVKPLGNSVTNAKGGQSWHNWGVAADVVYRKNGKFTWDIPDTAYLNLAAIAKDHGLAWGGSWEGNGKALGDLDHFEMTGGLSIQMAMNIGSMPKVWEEIRKRIQ